MRHASTHGWQKKLLLILSEQASCTFPPGTAIDSLPGGSDLFDGVEMSFFLYPTCTEKADR